MPWFGQEFEETRELMGENFWPYGIEANRTSLEALFQYSHEQGLASKQPDHRGPVSPLDAGVRREFLIVVSPGD